MSWVVDSDSVGSKVRAAPWGETECAHLVTLWTCRVHAKVTHWRSRLLVTRTHPIAVLLRNAADFAQVGCFGYSEVWFQMDIKLAVDAGVNGGSPVIIRASTKRECM